MGRLIDLITQQCILFLIFGFYFVFGLSNIEKREIKMQVLEMFQHGYQSYMNSAYPADELMPLSCKGRFRGTEPSRGDVDDTLGNFSLTLIDSLDTLVVLGQLSEFERAVKLVVRDVSFDNDIIVSVFETNIRVLGGLLSAHILASYLKEKHNIMLWYTDELLEMAKEVGYRLLPAFNTTSGVPYPKINLKYGINHCPKMSNQRETCTACAGTMILEFAALSRLTGEPIFEEKAHKAMEFLWKQRHRTSDLMGTVLNIHNGDWVRRDSGVGAGIDSYYEYCLKAYILLGNEIYLDRFNKHYSAVMKYVSQGPLLVDVLMHRPHTTAKNFMDSLLAFWPGLQVLKGDINPAIQTHEMLYQVIQRHTFLPEAFTVDFQVHWAQHPLRPEFVESTYFLYKATGDPYYLTVGKDVIKSLHDYARVSCGFAAVKDVRTGGHEDRMDSFVLAETFKYLYLLFAEKEDLVIDLDDYLFTTEAHLLPLTLGKINTTNPTTFSDTFVFGSYKTNNSLFEIVDDTNFDKSCPNTNYLFPGKKDYAHSVRQPLKNLVEELCPKTRSRRLRAADFNAGNQEQLEILNKMGIRLVSLSDGRIQLLHSATQALTPEDAREGVIFMQEMLEYSKQQNQQDHYPRIVQLIFPSYLNNLVLIAGPAQFGTELKGSPGVEGFIELAVPFKACGNILNSDQVRGKIVIVERGDCMFIDKARRIQEAGAIGGIVVDNNKSSTTSGTAIFAMSSDGNNDVTIPMVFLFASEGNILFEALLNYNNVKVLLTEKTQASVEMKSKEEGDKSEAVGNNDSKNSITAQMESNDLIELAGSLHSDTSKTKKNTFTISILNILKSLSSKQSTGEKLSSSKVESDNIIMILKRKLQEEKDVIELQHYLEYLKAMTALLQLTVGQESNSEDDTSLVQLNHLVMLIKEQITNLQTPKNEAETFRAQTLPTTDNRDSNIQSSHIVNVSDDHNSGSIPNSEDVKDDL